MACCVETDVWWKWPALIASSAFLLLTFVLLYYTYRTTKVTHQGRFTIRMGNFFLISRIFPPQSHFLRSQVKLAPLAPASLLPSVTLILQTHDAITTIHVLSQDNDMADFTFHFVNYILLHSIPTSIY